MEFKPIVGHFQPWGVIAFALKHKSKKDLLERAELCLHMGYQDRHQVGYRLLALQTNEFIITNNATFVLSSEILVKDLFGTELTEKRQSDLYSQLCQSPTSVLVNSGEKAYTKLGTGEGTRNVITRYPMRSLMKPTDKREPTITYSGMIPGEEPPYRPLLTEQIDIEQGLQELGQVSAGLVDVQDALEEWGEYHREPKLKGALSYLDQCIVDWDEEDLKNPSAYSWEGDNYSKGYSPHLTGWSGETGECVRSASKTPSGGHNIDRTQVLHVDGPQGSDYTGGRKSSLSKTPSGGHNSDRLSVYCSVQPPVWIKRCMSYHPLSL